MIDLCIVSYNSENYLPRLFDTLKFDLSDYPADLCSIYIADNGSQDNSVDVIREWQQFFKREYPEVRFEVLIQDNVGYAKACNDLAAMGNGDIVALCNADIWFYACDVMAIQISFDNNPDIDILGPKQRDEVGRITHAGIFGSLNAPKHRGWREYDAADQLYRDRLPAVTVSGSAYFVRRSVWEDLTNCPIFRESCPEATGAFLLTKHYYEETYCSYHAHAHNHKVYYDGTVSIGHTWHASSPVGGVQDGYFEDSRKIFRAACDLHQIPRD